jgi:two-component system, OmpR family, phosphate regulon sensor histidine kinase PhoR
MNMKRHSFFFRLVLGNLLLVPVLVVIAGVFLYHNLNTRLDKENRASQWRQTQLLQKLFEDLWPQPSDQINRHVRDLATGSLERLTVIAADGQVLGDSEADPRIMENHLTPGRPEITQALQGLTGENIRRSETRGVEYRYFALPVRKDGQIVAAVRLALPAEVLIEEHNFLQHALYMAVLITAVTIASLVLLISWLWYRPFRLITNTARDIAAGNLAVKAPLTGAREMVELSQAINDMRQSLTRQITLLDVQRCNLQTAVANLKEGVIAIDAETRVVLVNPAVRTLLDIDDVEMANAHLQAVIRNSDIVDAYGQASADAVHKEIEVEFPGRPRRLLDVYAVRLKNPPEGGIVGLIVLHDITDMARTAAMKAEFVANASHELRTPLATLRAAVDFLRESHTDDPAERMHLIEILDRHLRHLEELTRDMLDLHTVETGKRKLRLEPVRLSDLLSGMNEQFASRANEKNISLTFVLPDPLLEILTDRKLLELILQNLIDNALKFTPAGGTVACHIERRTDLIIFRVADTGCGIRPEDRPRIFDRFFQADPARSGDAGIRGTGLGLAIVKHAAERLNAVIDIQSIVGTGTTVTVRLPGLQQE